MNDIPVVWMNGELISADEVRVSPFDLGLAVGWGVFETMAGYEGKVFGFLQHYERLEHSASVLDIRVPPAGLLETAVCDVMLANKLTSGRSRIRLSLGGGNHSLSGGGEAKSTRGNVIVSAVTVPKPEEWVKLMMVPFPHNERSGLSGTKTASYGNNVHALRYAVAEGAGEAILLNTRGYLCEAATSNLFLVKDGMVKTPSLGSGCLAGVTRAIVIGLCHENGIGLDECELSMAEVEKADEIFLTSSTRGVQSSFLLEHGKKPVRDVTMQISGFYKERVRGELGL